MPRKPRNAVPIRRRPAESPTSHIIVCVVILVAAVVAAFGNGIRGRFVFDDIEAIVENPSIRRLSDLRTVLSPPVDTTVAGRPLVNLSLAINFAIGKLDPTSYHVANIAIHAAAALLLFGILRRMLKLLDSGATAWPALAMALIWEVHPLHTESVTYVSTRTESLMGMLLLATLYCSLRAMAPVGQTGVRRRLWTGLAILASAAGMATKEVMAVAPLLVLLVDRQFVSFSFAAACRARPWLYGGLAGTWAIFAALTLGARGKSVGFSYSEATPLQYFMTQLGVITHYLGLAFWPSPLTLDYQDWPVARSFITVWPQAVLILGLIAAALLGVLRRHPLGLAGAWFLLVLAPTSSVIPIVTEIAAERRMYLPLAAVVAVVFFLVQRGLRRVVEPASLRRVIGGGVIGAATIALGVATINRNQLYASPLELWRQTVAVRPQNVRAQHNLGLVLASDGRWSEAEPHFRTAVQIEPRYARAQTGLAMALTVAGRLDEAEAIFATAIRLDPSDGLARLGLGNVFMSRGDWAAAAGHFRDGVRIRPADSRARSNFGLALRNAGNAAEAAEQFRAALALDPSDWLANSQLGWLMLEAGRKREAAAHFEAALRQRPNDAELRRALQQARG
ncbi:cellulose synthase subunit BcsC [Phycisphaerae bacterium RAS1]|nr:cellulose synthase subunit BcsC [Phycisphaerae bacterium RAS1]